MAIGRSILVIIWALLSDEQAQFVDLGRATPPPAPTPSAESATTSGSQALGYTVTPDPAA